MRIVVAPDSFGLTLTAPQAAEAIADGVRAQADAVGRDDVDIVTLPMSDGGPGFIDALRAGLGPDGARAIEVPVTGPHGEAGIGTVLLTPDAVAYVESAQAAGLQMTARRDPLWATSYGVGTLMRAAVEAGARSVTVGLGGSATNDGGVGMLAALGITAYDEAGLVLQPGALPLLGVHGVRGTAALRTASVVAATDVDNPLTGPEGASAVFGPQKGASPRDVEVLDLALRRWGEVLQRDRPVPEGLASRPGAGAAGGMGAALFALRATRRSGFDVVSEALGLEAVVADADLVITGEGSFDEQSVRGKVAGSVARLAQRHGKPCVVIAGRCSLGRRQAAAYGVDEMHELLEHAGEERAMAEAADVTCEVARAMARQWVR